MVNTSHQSPPNDESTPEEALRATKSFAEAIVNTIHEPLLVLTPGLRVKFANPAFCAELHLQPEATHGRLVYELGNGQWDIPELRTFLEEVLPDSRVCNELEVRHVFESLGRRVMLINARRIDYEQLILLSFRDITEQTRAAEALRESEARQGFLLHLSDRIRPLIDPVEIQFAAARTLGEHLRAARVGYAEDVGDGETVAVTRNYTDGVPGIEGRYQYADYGPELVAQLREGRTVVRPNIPEDSSLSPAEREAHEVLQLGSTVNVPLVKGERLVAILFVHHREPRFWTRNELSLMLETAERTWSAVERARAEEALRQIQIEAERLKRLYETILSNTPDLVYTFGLDYRFTFVNEALLQLWGRTLEDSAGKSLREIGYEPWYAERHEREIDEIIASKQPLRGEVAFPHAALGRRIYDYILVPVLDAQGEVEAIAGTTRDVTERKQAELALFEAKLAAEQASQAKSQFLAVMSHELRTPLTGVIGFAELLETEVFGPVSEKQRDALVKIKANAWHLVSIIDEILTVSRMDAGKERAQYEEVDMAAITRDVVGILEPQAESQGLVLRLLGTESPVPVWTDPGKVRQILVNLAGNAVRYTERGEVTIHLDHTDPDWLALHVRDTGPGIAPEDQERIFEAFTQVDSSHTRGAQGTGLGLAIAQKMARLLGGDVVLQSTLGRGSTFTLRLPRRRAEVS